MVIREAAGLAQPLPDDRIREGEMDIVAFLELGTEMGFRQPAMERFLRAAGDSLRRRVAEIENDWWESEAEEPPWRPARARARLRKSTMTDG